MVAGSKGASSPFFSVDGNWLAFFRGTELLRVSLLDGGPPLVVAISATGGYGATWGPEDLIVFSSLEYGPLSMVSVGGGPPRILVGPDSEAGERGLRWPQFLPGGQRLIFSAIGATPKTSRIIGFDRATGRRLALVEGGRGRYLPSGHLIFSRGAKLYLVRVHPRSLAVLGDPVAIETDLVPPGDSVRFDVALDGALLLVRGRLELVRGWLPAVDRALRP